MTLPIRAVLRSGAAGAVLCASVLLHADIAAAQTFEVLHTFPSCSYNVGLFSALVQGADGNFYGTTNVSSGLGGTVYRITPAGDVTVLHTFVGGPTDGSNPKAPLVLASDGNFYGTTLHGGGAGAGNGGTLFRMTPAGVVTIVHGFAGGSADGWNPTRLIQASDGNLYGVTTFGGANNVGTVFRMTLGGAFALVYSFAGGSDNGSGPTTLLEANDGTFYGMTSGGGATGNGTVFRTTWDGQTTFLYGSFQGVVQNGSSFWGSRPGGDLMQATDGNFYGTIHDHTSPVSSFSATIFKITPEGTLTIFVGLPGRTASGLIQASDGNLYGVAFRVFDQMQGTPHQRRFFKVTLGGSVSTVPAVTESSCTSTSDAMLHADDGKFYGTTGAGVVYSLSLPPTVSPSTLTLITGRTGVFTADAVGMPGATFQWQVSTDGGGAFTNVIDGGAYSGASTSTLSVTPQTTAINGYLFRAVATNSGGSETTGTATLVVRNRADATDLDGDGQSDLTVFRPGASFNWLVRNSSSGYSTSTTYARGLSGDVPVAGDYDADGVTDVAVYRPSNGQWYVRRSSDLNNGLFLQWGLTGDLPVPGDYDGDGQTDIAVFRPSTGVWFVATSSSNYASFVTYALGLGRDIPVPSDYDGDGATDIAVYRPSTGMWFVRRSGTSTAFAMPWGLTGDVPVPGDYDGDGKADLAVYRPDFGVWYVLLSSTNFSTFTTTQWGLNGDTPVPGDYDDDGKIDLAVYRPSNGTWYISQSSTNYSTSVSYQWGVAGDVPVPNAPGAHALATAASRPTTSTQVNLSRTSDFDRDGIADVTVYRPSTGTWFTAYSTTLYAGSATFQWGVSTDRPMPGDYDGDGTTDIVVYSPGTGSWNILRSSTDFSTSTAVQWGLSGDVPLTGDYDGDGKIDPAVYRPSAGIWYILQSSTNYGTSIELQWGLSSDVPVPGDYDGDALTDPAVYRPSTGEWFVKHSSTSYATSASYQWGLAGDISVPGEYDGDGKTDLAVYRPSTGQWFVRESSTGYATSTSFQWGLTDDIPVPADFDGDGKTDLAVWRPSTGEWYVLRSSSGFTDYDQVRWGLSGDVPILMRP